MLVYQRVVSPEVFRLEGVSDTVSGGHELIFSMGGIQDTLS